MSNTSFRAVAARAERTISTHTHQPDCGQTARAPPVTGRPPWVDVGDPPPAMHSTFQFQETCT